MLFATEGNALILSSILIFYFIFLYIILEQVLLNLAQDIKVLQYIIFVVRCVCLDVLSFIWFRSCDVLVMLPTIFRTIVLSLQSLDDFFILYSVLLFCHNLNMRVVIFWSKENKTAVANEGFSNVVSLQMVFFNSFMICAFKIAFFAFKRGFIIPAFWSIRFSFWYITLQHLRRCDNIASLMNCDLIFCQLDYWYNWVDFNAFKAINWWKAINK